MALDGVTRAALDPADDLAQVAVGHVDGAAAGRADDMVVVTRSAGDVGVLAVRQVESFDRAGSSGAVEPPSAASRASR